MKTIEVFTSPEPTNPNSRIYHVSDILQDLSKIRGRPILKDTFRRWRKRSLVTNRIWYSENDIRRLAIIAKHLFEGGLMNDIALDVQLLEQFENETSS